MGSKRKSMGDYACGNSLKNSVLIVCLFLVHSISCQIYENGSLDMGAGGVISIGLQEEAGFDVRLQYTTSDTRIALVSEYNQYFVKEFENTRTFREFMFTYNRRLFTWKFVDITGGVGYVLNNYKVLARAEDTSNLFFTTGTINHGALLKFRALYQISIPVHLFFEINFKSFGKRYDTIAFGLTYSLGL